MRAPHSEQRTCEGREDAAVVSEEEIAKLREVVATRREAGVTPLLRVVSLGAGVQSTAMALMAAHGEIGPMPDCAIFADTQWEPQGVYDHLRWMRSANVLPFPVLTVTAGNLRDSIASERPIEKFLRVDIPAFVSVDGLPSGLINRSCTRDYKITPIRRAVRDIVGITGRKSPDSAIVEQWIGISTDEVSRMKPGREAWQQNRWPLIEAKMSRQDCLSWMRRNGYPEPHKSSCIGCPFHSDDEWRALSEDEMRDAVEVDDALRKHGASSYRTKGVLYLHRSCRPLSEVDFSTAEDAGQVDMFKNECEGMCGV